MRQLIKEADPEVVEEWKWMGTPLKDPARLIAPDGLSRYHRVGSVEVASPRFSRIWVPAGNTGRANVSTMQPMPIADDLRRVLEQNVRQRPGVGHMSLGRSTR